MNGKDCSVLKNIHGIWSVMCHYERCRLLQPAYCLSAMRFLLPASLNLIRKGLLGVIGTFVINPGKNKDIMRDLLCLS